jgi:hypothetical protein
MYLTSQQFEQALAILQAEQPLQRQEGLFRLLRQAVWGTMLFLSVYILTVTVAGAKRAYPALLIAVGCSLATTVLFFVNLGLMNKLRRAASLRRQLRLSERLRASFRARRRHHPIRNAVTFAVSVVGVLTSAVGLFGLVESLREPDAFGFEFAASLTVFGFTCVCIHFMARGAERLTVIAELRSSLLEGRNASNAPAERPIALAAADYDEISEMERRQISRARERSVEIGRASNRESYVLKTSQAFRHSAIGLEAGIRGSIDERIHKLLVDPTPRDARLDEATGLRYVTVPDTPLEIAYTVDHDRRELRAFALRDRTAERARP